MGYSDSRLKTWTVLETAEVKDDLSRYIGYLLKVKKNEQAAEAVLLDYDETIDELSRVAGSLPLMSNPRFAVAGYQMIRFRRHDYYLIYRMTDDIAVVYQMLHFLQDRDNSIR